MKNVLKRAFSLALAIVMLASFSPAFATTIYKGENGNTIYVSFTFSDGDGNPVTEVAKDGMFSINVNFSGNPTVKENSIQGYDLLIGYDPEKILFEYGNDSALEGLTSPTFNYAFTTGVSYAGWASEKGIVKNRNIQASGTLFSIDVKAGEALTEADLKAIKLVASAQSGSKKQYTNMADGSKKTFTIVQAPAIVVGEINGEVYSDAGEDEVKALISSISIIDATGNATEYTPDDAEWSNLSVQIPADVVVGKNTATAVFEGYTCDFEYIVADRLKSISITTAPTKTTYTAFETFDKAGMVVTANFESGATEVVTDACMVDTTTELKVADESWIVTYNDKTATQAITVNPKKIDKPVASGTYTYTGQSQTFTYATAPDADYVTVTGDTYGKDAKTYTAKAILKDKANTVWKENNSTADITLSWTIDKANITQGFTLDAIKYTTKYSKLPTTQEVKGVNNENVTANITWYKDADCTQTVNGADQIAESYTGVEQVAQLYYKATGMANYADYKGTVSVSVIDKDVATITWTNAPSGLTVSGKTGSGTYATAGYTVADSMFTVTDKTGATLSGSKTVAITKSGEAVAKITDAGTYDVTVTYEDVDNKGSETFTVTISPKSIAGFKVSLKDGFDNTVETSEQTAAQYVYSGADITPEVVGVADLTANDYEVATIVAQKNVQADAYTVTITGKGNYSGTATGYWKITPATVNVSGVTVADKQFNGQTSDANVTAVAFSGLKGTDTLVLNTDYEITGAAYASADVSDSASVNVTVALKNTALAKNYILGTNSVVGSAVITKAAAPILDASAVQTLLSSAVTTEAKDYSINLASVITGIPENAGAVTYSVKTEGNYAKKIGTGIDGSTLKVNVATAQVVGTTDSVVVTVSTANYEDTDVTINFEFKNKTTVSVTMEDKNVTYGEAYTMSGVYANQPASGYTWKYSYIGIDGTDYAASETAPTRAGKYSVTATYEDNAPDSGNPDIPGHVGSATATLTIDKKIVTVTAGDVAITKVYDGTTDAGNMTGALALTGKIGEDDVLVDMSSKAVGAYPDSEVGTYTVEISGLDLGGDAKDNYALASNTFSFANAKITKQLQSSLTINGGSENIEATMFGNLTVTVAGGDGNGAYGLTSSDTTVATLSAGDSGNWTVNLLKPGTTTLTATKAADNNYEAAEAVAITLTVVPKTIADSDFVFDLENKVYTKGFINPEVTAEGMSRGVDYDVVYSNNVNVGEAIITVTGKGNYTGEIVKNFNITKKALNDSEFVVNISADSFKFIGSAIEPAVVVAWAENGALAPETDYTVAYSENVNVGTATITVSGVGNYDGALAKTFAITPAEYLGTVVITADVSTIAEGTVLTANAPAGGELTYQWMKNSEAIDENGTADTYTVTVADTGSSIFVVVTSTGNYVGSLTSGEVVVGKTVLPATLEITGDRELELVINNAPEEENYSIVWLRDGVVIPDANGTTYTIAYEDLGCEITAKLISIGDIYTGEVISGNSISVPALAPGFDAAPTVENGVGKVRILFSAKANGSEIISYQIFVDDVLVDTIAGTETSYTLDGLTNGLKYTVKIVAINAVGSTTSDAVVASPKKSSGGGGGSGGSSSTKNSIKTSTSDVAGGSVKFSEQKASVGQKVSITATPDEGYKLAELIVVDSKGNKLEVAEKGDIYEFIMPDSAITVEAKFVEIIDTPDTVVGFVDVDDNAYYKSAVDWAVKAGITNGTDANKFSPETECTRAQIVTFLWRAAGMPEASTTNKQFTDVAEDSYYGDAVAWAVENGITAGVGEGKFDPDAIVDRAQTVTFLWRLAKTPAVDSDDSFEDVDAGAYYGDAVAWALQQAITNGVSDNAFGPADSCTRAQIVTFLFRYFAE